MKEEQKPENVNNAAKASAEEKKDAQGQAWVGADRWKCFSCGYSMMCLPPGPQRCPNCGKKSFMW